ncbi:MAG: tetratricopeptide repeat protein [Candidatus Thorarchaeota archaeon]
MPDSWELQFSELDPSNYWDRFVDSDDDGIMNCLECFLNTYPNDTDSDHDNMPDGWEFLGGLDPTVIDSNNDNDDDGISALYEFQMGLNPRIDDAANDSDNDGLTNLQEFHFGSWANQSDSDLDGMPDFWEFTHSDDGYQFNPRNSSDTKDDPDNDWVNNLDEYRGQSNPRHFWSVPFFAFSTVLLIRLISILGIASVYVVLVLKYRDIQRKAFTTNLGAQDYATVLIIKKAGLNDYSALLQAEKEAKEVIQVVNSSYYQGKYRKAIQLYEQALTVFERTENDFLRADIVFRIAHIYKELQELTANSLVLKLLPRRSDPIPVIGAVNHMLLALVAEAEQNWGTAIKA